MCTHNLCFEQKYEKHHFFLLKMFNFYNLKNLCILHGHVFITQFKHAVAVAITVFEVMKLPFSFQSANWFIGCLLVRYFKYK